MVTERNKKKRTFCHYSCKGIVMPNNDLIDQVMDKKKSA